MNKKVVSFSIFGDNLRYLSGIEPNINLIRLFYPGWHIYIYFDDSVPDSIILKLRDISDVKLINMTGMNLPGMFWRFLPYDDLEVELFIVRDLDSRISIRESVAVYEWIKSSKYLHIMRDHPFHVSKILGGMWGLKRSKDFSMLKEMKLFLESNKIRIDLYQRQIDQDFLDDIIYRKFFFSKLVHASFNKYELLSSSFTVDRVSNCFVGEVFIENEQDFSDRQIIYEIESKSIFSITSWIKDKFTF